MQRKTVLIEQFALAPRSISPNSQSFQPEFLHLAHSERAVYTVMVVKEGISYVELRI